jgi:hypothetical protein
MSSETRTLKINQQSERWDSPFTSQYTVTGNMETFADDWKKCVEHRKAEGYSLDEADVIEDMESIGYEFVSNNFDVIEVKL